MTKVYCGYDESNNAQIPEFHILCYSNNVEYIKEKGNLIKGKNSNETIEQVLKDDFNFYFLVYFKEFDNELDTFLHQNNLSFKKTLIKKIIVLYSIVQKLQENNNFNLNIDLFFDGILGERDERECIKNILKHFNLVTNSIKFVKNGDEKYDIINVCDKIAYQFLVEFNQLGNEMFKERIESLPNRFWENRVYVDFNKNLKNKILEFLNAPK